MARTRTTLPHPALSPGDPAADLPDQGGRAGAVALWRDPVILAVLGLSIAAGAWYLVGWGGERSRVVGFGFCLPVLNLVLAVLCRRVARLPGLPRPTRRFWNALAVSGTCSGVGDSIQVIINLTDPHVVATATVTGTAHQIGFVVGACFPIWVMLTLPSGTGSRRQRIRFWLDAGTVMVGAAAFAWYLNVDDAGVSTDPATLLGPVLVMGIQLVAAFAVVKLLLTGAAGFVRAAAICGAMGAGLEGLSAGAVPAMTGSPWLPLLVAAQTVPGAMIVCAPRIQELLVRADPALLSPARRRPYSLLPYLAVAATLALLIVVLAADGIETSVWGVLAGVVVSTALVVARQLTAFAENASLLTRLDGTVRELGRKEDLLRHQASHDHLTQLANRALFTERSERSIHTGDDPAAVIMIDLDEFKSVNDTLGHHVGDAVLVAVADRLRNCVRPGDTVARLGGDEFAVLLLGATDTEAAAAVERITAALAEPVPVAGHLLTVHASIGLATGTSDGAEALLRAADDAMYAAKRVGTATRGRRQVGTIPDVVLNWPPRR